MYTIEFCFSLRYIYTNEYTNVYCLHPSYTIYILPMQPVGAAGRTVTPGGAAGPERKVKMGRTAVGQSAAAGLVGTESDGNNNIAIIVMRAERTTPRRQRANAERVRPADVIVFPKFYVRKQITLCYVIMSIMISNNIVVCVLISTARCLFFHQSADYHNCVYYSMLNYPKITESCIYVFPVESTYTCFCFSCRLVTFNSKSDNNCFWLRQNITSSKHYLFRMKIHSVRNFV